MARKAWWRRLLALGALLAVSLLLLEVLLWATDIVGDPSEFQFRRIAQDVHEDAGGRYATHPRRFYSTAPGYRHSATHLGRDATGDWPFRGRPAEPAPPDQLRVAVLGDSCVYGAKLDAADMLGTRLGVELAARGLTQDRVAVLSLGVPGYSTVQIGLLLEETLERWSPDAVVLYPAAWNDQAPALRKPDRELLAELNDPSPWDWLRHRSRVVTAITHVLERRPVKEIVAGWEAGDPPLGYRVPAEQVGENVRGMIDRCREAGVSVVVVAPAHPPETRAKFPRTGQDAAAVLAAARAAGVAALDAQARLTEAGEDHGRHFTDNVHPSPRATEILAPVIADAVLEALGSVGPSTKASTGSALRVVGLSPERTPVLGDIRLRVSLAGWSASDELPTVVVGGAPLLEVRPAGSSAIEGTLMANAPGTHAVVVQTSTGSAVSPFPLVIEDPSMEIVPAALPLLVVHGRPGDQLRLFAAPATATVPEWSNRGASWLDPVGRVQVAEDLTLDADGRAEITLPAITSGVVHLQAILAPPDTPPGSAVGSRWTSVVTLTIPD
jgi:lysophospholipase L1-like esterase